MIIRLNMDICKYLVLDEGDRMLDLGFDEEVRWSVLLIHIRAYFIYFCFRVFSIAGGT